VSIHETSAQLWHISFDYIVVGIHQRYLPAGATSAPAQRQISFISVPAVRKQKLPMRDVPAPTR